MRIGILVLAGLMGSGLGWGELAPMEKGAEEVEHEAVGGGVSGEDGPLVRGTRWETNGTAARMNFTDMRMAQRS